ncbi:hypothetical protein HFP15_37495 [Amycolatopsis sp. K13G38]|uniref:HTH hxlR-type domain-containing protein n=1 Tax=Amycolatopsis acididurans TaxID=2724524 RepID=A0ABX1JH67_9PSEU|nr:winged helix-turn-helix transcriptional regulator [Amycolatopsis acididurans]NKQ58556.1 hypothetical protein [Amycolatopsis acididurans]
MADERLALWVAVAACPGAAEALDALADGPRSFLEIRRRMPVSRRELWRALRTLAVEGALIRCEPGSWDGGARRSTFVLTAGGHHLRRELASLEVWVAVYEHFLHRPPRP